MTTPLRDKAGRFRSRVKRGAQRTLQHAAGHKKTYSFGLIALGFMILQAIWDVSMNDLSAYTAPLFAKVFGPPPAP